MVVIVEQFGNNFRKFPPGFEPYKLTKLSDVLWRTKKVKKIVRILR